VREGAFLRSRQRNDSIDQFRGLLIVLVILGHLFEVTHRHPFVTWLGFGFRMPVFIGLTGYLFNLDRARAEPLFVLLRRYYRRLILPWMAASLVYLLLARPFDWFIPLHVIVRPPYHLWFVPVMLAFVIMSWASRLRPRMMLAVAIPISVIGMIVFGVGHEIRQYYAWVPDRRYFIFPAYFTLGLCVARRPSLTWARYVAAFLVPIALLWWAWLYNHPSQIQEALAELLLCMPLIYLIPKIREYDLHFPFLTAIGRESLFVYLWHPLALGIWLSIGVTDLSTLIALAFLSLAIAWSAFARVPVARTVLGIRNYSDAYLNLFSVRSIAAASIR